LKHSRFLFSFPKLGWLHVIRKLLSKIADRERRKKLLLFKIIMPGAVNGSEGLTKRKRVESKNRPSKRTRSESSEEDVQSRILLLETQVFESKKNYNNISTLIQLSRNRDDDIDVSLVSSIALCRIFSRLLASGDLTKVRATTEKESVVTLWLRERYSEYKAVLIQLLNRDGSESTALTLCMRMLKNEGTHLRNGQEYSFPTLFLKDIVQSILSPDGRDSIRREFIGKYLEEYDDVRFYTFAAIE
jgi:U3 small nucleolar RNA-associated protein 19